MTFDFVDDLGYRGRYVQILSSIYQHRFKSMIQMWKKNVQFGFNIDHLLFNINHIRIICSNCTVLSIVIMDRVSHRRSYHNSHYCRSNHSPHSRHNSHRNRNLYSIRNLNYSRFYKATFETEMQEYVQKLNQNANQHIYI